MGMTNHQLNGLLIGALLLFNSCAKDELHNTTHPTLGAVQVTTDWTGHTAEATLPTHYTLRIGTTEKEVSGSVNEFHSLLQPSRYTLLAYNTPQGITVNGNTATVNLLPDGTLEPMPGYLFSGTTQLTAIADNIVRVILPMKQRIRQLTLILKLKAGDDARIASITSALTGVATSIDLATGVVTATEGKTVIPTFALIKVPATKRNGTRAATDSIKLKNTVRLVGVVSTEKQKLNLNFTLNDGSVQSVSTNLTALLENFTKTNLEPLVLDATLELPAEAGVSATITDWAIVENGNVDIH
ncbi:MAG: FimB/Mfa2 family fimbrial subunit [Bacteroides sp.]